MNSVFPLFNSPHSSRSRDQSSKITYLRHNDFMSIHLSQDRFDELVSEALDEVPARLLTLMDNIVILVDDDPPDDCPNLLGLYEGYALTERGWDYSGALPDRITIYRNPILDLCSNESEVAEEVKITVIHEIAHHFGISDDYLHELGWS